jgi:hypothetical protein
MLRLSGTMCLAVVLTIAPRGSEAQTVAAGWDVCAVAWFHDEATRREFDASSRALEADGRHQSALAAIRDATAGLLSRLSADLKAARAATEQAVREATRSPALSAVQQRLAGYCLERIKRSPRSYTDAVFTQAARLKRQAALAADERAEAFRSDTDQLRRDVGTPEAAARTIGLVLDGLGSGF